MSKLPFILRSTLALSAFSLALSSFADAQPDRDDQGKSDTTGGEEAPKSAAEASDETEENAGNSSSAQGDSVPESSTPESSTRGDSVPESSTREGSTPDKAPTETTEASQPEPAKPSGVARDSEDSSEIELSLEEQAMLAAALAAAEEGTTGETVLIRGSEKVQPGSAHTVDSEALERFESDDVHRILHAVPGVYMREEDGYGLRPNIGMRGSGTERSSKIALMEDGVLIAPAPYSAPAAYYFPLVTRMQTIEVVKGASAVRHGPNTVGGAINMVSNSIPYERTAAIDIAGGETRYGKLQLQAGDRGKYWGAWVEGLRLQSDGFKEIDGGGDAGFAKNDFLAHGQINTNPDRAGYHELRLTLGYSDETSNETYTGLSDEDFSENPFRRYAATQLDKMDWRHLRGSLRHRYEAASGWVLESTAYHHRFQRDWGKLTGFSGSRSIEDVLADPDTGLNAVYYQVLTGQADTSSDAERIHLGTNARKFVSQGVQSVFTKEMETGELLHEMSFGLRLHHDRAHRRQLRDSYSMVSGRLVSDNMDTFVGQDAVGSALAGAFFAEDVVRWKKLHVSGGLRGELISTKWEDSLDSSNDVENTFGILIPGLGAFYSLTDKFGFLGGVHRGFVPVSPGQDPSIDPETSVNYEAGVRYGDSRWRAEVIGFANDYGNLKATCSFSAGCTPEMNAVEFNGFGAYVYGAEVFAAGEINASSLAKELFFPLRLSYTFNDSHFKQDFNSSNPQWGDVEEGDELPYLAKHQLSMEAGTRWKGADFAISYRWQSQMRDIAGQGEADSYEKVDGYQVVDLALSYQIPTWGKIYSTWTNIFDSTYAVSRRPYGLRPGKPRTLTLGYKNRF